MQPASKYEWFLLHRPSSRPAPLRLTAAQSGGQPVFYLNSYTACLNKDMRPREELYKKKFRILYNYFPAEHRHDCNATVTYTTHATSKYLKHLYRVLERWEAPISISVYAPGKE